VIIDNFNLLGTVGAFRPLEADTPLTVYPNAKLAFSIARQRFKMVAWKSGKISQIRGRFQHSQSLLGLVAETLKREHALAFSNAPCPGVSVAPYHSPP
jgi:hypothetical protein